MSTGDNIIYLAPIKVRKGIKTSLGSNGGCKLGIKVNLGRTGPNTIHILGDFLLTLWYIIPVIE